MAKASFSAYLSGFRFRLGRKCTFRPKRARPILVALFSFLFPCICVRIAKKIPFLPFNSQKVGRKRGLRHLCVLSSEILRRGRSWGQRCANLSQIVRQICAKLLVFPFVHHTKGTHNCRKLVANLQAWTVFYANSLFQCPFSKFLRIDYRGRTWAIAI